MTIVFIYRITNTVNNKQYIGQTTVPVLERFRQHKISSHCRALYSAIKKYGEKSFLVDTLCVCSDQDYADYVEKTSITAFNTFAPNGYNLREGGLTRHRFSKESIELMRKAAKLRGVSKECRQAQRISASNPSDEVRAARSVRMKQLLKSETPEQKAAKIAKVVAHTKSEVGRIKARNSAFVGWIKRRQHDSG